MIDNQEAGYGSDGIILNAVGIPIRWWLFEMPSWGSRGEAHF